MKSYCHKYLLDFQVCYLLLKVSDVHGMYVMFFPAASQITKVALIKILVLVLAKLLS